MSVSISASASASASVSASASICCVRAIVSSRGRTWERKREREYVCECIIYKRAKVNYVKRVHEDKILRRVTER